MNSDMNKQQQQFQTQGQLKEQQSHPFQIANQEQKNKENEDNQSENNKVQSLQQIFQRLKLKIVSKKMVNNTNSRMFKNLNNLQYHLINDKSIYLNEKRVQLATQKARKQITNSFQLQDDVQQEEDSWYIHIYFSLAKLSLFRYLAYIRRMIPIISPSSTFKLTWDFVHMISILIYMFLIPINISFGLPFYYLLSYQLHHITPYSLLFDMCINMITSYYDKGVLVTSGFKIIKNYIIQHGITDMLSIMPFLYNYWTQEQIQDENLLDLTDGEQFANRPVDYSIEKFFMLFFFMKIFSFQHIIKKIEERSHLSRKMSNIISLIKLLFTIITIAHILACTWIFMGRLEHQANIVNTWQDNVGITTKRWYIQYIYAFYFSTVTMVTVGYGDILPKTPQEMVLSIGAIMISCGVFGYSLNEVGSIFHELSRTEREINQNMQVINYYMDTKKVKGNLQFQIREYLSFYWMEISERDKEAEDKIIGQLSDALKEDLLIEANKIVLKDSPIFKNNFSDKIIYKTIPLIKETRCTPEQIIMREGELDDCQIFFIEKGSIEIYIDIIIPGKLQEQPFVIQELKEGDYFGVESFFTGNYRMINARSKQFTTLLMINRSDFLQLLKGFPDDYEQFCAIKDNIMHYHNYEQLGLNCYCCNSSKHQLLECPIIHYTVNKTKIIKQYNKFQIQNREQFDRLRYKDKKQATLKNLNQNQQLTEIYQDENEESISYQISINGYEQENDEQDDDAQQNEQNNENKSDNDDNEDIKFADKDQIQKHYTQQQDENNNNSQNNNQIQVIQEQLQRVVTPQKTVSPSLSNRSINTVTFSPSPSIQNIQSNIIQKMQQYSNPLKFYTQQLKQESNSQDIILQKSLKERRRKSSQLLNHKQIKKVNKIKDFVHAFKMINMNKAFQPKLQSNSVNNNNQMQMIFNLMQNQMESQQKANFINEDQFHELEDQQFDQFKDYHYYFPYNNLSYQVQLLQLDPEQRKFKTERIHLDNKLLIKRSQNKSSGQRQQIIGNKYSQLQNKYEYEQKYEDERQRKLSKAQENIQIKKPPDSATKVKKSQQGSLLLNKKKSQVDSNNKQSAQFIINQDASKQGTHTLEQIKEVEENKEEQKDITINVKNDSEYVTANQSLLKSFIINNNNNEEDHLSNIKINIKQKHLEQQSTKEQQKYQDDLISNNQTQSRLQQDDELVFGSERKPTNIIPFVIGLFGQHLSSNNSQRSVQDNTNNILDKINKNQNQTISLHTEKLNSISDL